MRRSHFGLVALGTFAAVALAVPGEGGAGGLGCPDDRVCVWEHDDGNGVQVKLRGRGVSNKLADKMNNEASSLFNNTGGAMFLYDKRNAKGDRVCFGPSVEVPSFTIAGKGFNDRASSAKLTGRDDCPPVRRRSERRGGSCQEGSLCIYEDQGGGGQIVRINSQGVSNRLAEKMNNAASSAINFRNKRAYLYDKRNGKGARLCFDPGSKGNIPPGFDDRASSSKNTSNGQHCPAG
jgi:Peptidase inhibitor family I36